ncbi:MAG: hypothetical protein C4524_05655 [Candidatus Zixiibacteriota bacterium]|nr:MAG: hypothetical protein C4524_05655 [candidate division Zixibacteria bacterium]
MEAPDSTIRFDWQGRTVTVQRLESAAGDPTLRVTGEDGRARAWHSLRDPRREAAAQAAAFAAASRGRELWVFLGVGLGYLARELQARPPAGLVCVECHPELTDPGAWVDGERDVMYFAGWPADRLAAEIRRLARDRGCQGIRVLVNPAAEASFPSYYRPLRRALETTEPQKCDTPRAGSRRFFQPGTFLVLDGGYFLVREIVRGLEELGHRAYVVLLPQDAPGDASRQFAEFLKTLALAARDLRARALITVNHLGFDREGMLTGFLARLRLPTLVWYVDSPRYILRNPAANASPWVGTFVWDPSYLPWMQAQGFDRAHYLPLGVDPATFAVAARNAGRDDTLVFVGDSMAATTAKAWGKLPPELTGQLADTGSAAAKAAQHFGVLAGNGGFRTPPWEVLRQTVAECGEISGLTEEASLDLESFLALEATRNRRVEFMRRLAAEADLPLAIHGDQGWKAALNGKGEGRVELRGEADYYGGLPGLYAQAGAVLNLTGMQMPAALNQRCYDVPAAGGFLLTDDQPALAEQFEPGREAVTFASPDELADKWRYYRSHPAEREQIVRRGRERALKQHTYRHRLGEMLEAAGRWFPET